jgi:hypothetical protein
LTVVPTRQIDIGQPIRRHTVIPAHQPVMPTPEPTPTLPQQQPVPQQPVKEPA